jgi:hypothetical protein
VAIHKRYGSILEFLEETLLLGELIRAIDGFSADAGD